MSDFSERNLVSDNFQYDGVSLPAPDKYWIEYEEVTQDMERLYDNGEMVGKKIGDAKQIRWRYKLILADTYDTLVNKLVENGGNDPFHTLRTLDHKDQPFEIVVYRTSAFNQEPEDQDHVEFKDPNAEDLYAEDNLIRQRIFKDVELTFICKKVKQ